VGKKLAILGGKPILNKPFDPVYNISKKEIESLIKLLGKGPLSDFVGITGDKFLGGKQVRKLEFLFCKKFGSRFAVTFNSATTALQAAVASLEIGPGDEVIVPPYTMSASATSILANGAVPVFADIDEDNFCVDPTSIEKVISSRTKAIMIVNLFGNPADFDQILKIAKKYKLKTIEDNAQAPGAQYKGKYTGTIADVGVFSFNVHKVIQIGEGGVLVTNNKHSAYRAQLVRNHGEIVADEDPNYHLGPVMGNNFRMSEIHALLGYYQLKKLDFLNEKRLDLVNHLRSKLADIEGFILPKEDKDKKHVYYVFPIKIDENKLGISRNLFVEAMAAEGFPMSKGYVKPIYLLKLFQEKHVFNQTHFPFDYDGYNTNYDRGLCPVTERLYEKELTFTDICQHPRTYRQIDLFFDAVNKVLQCKLELLE